ncbi:unnamed protein product [Pseudo-nitzschia multistriata]|uniref:Plastid lipid-associated protein/fibrillin conserved domain-containing protein n=1 Tax=Pseudo-nitzschia multistriata TaxID=183589 RepID=A0A448ZGI3_9STRA|nr:unnamed protein product [Pseudo-nitzschia multistriata]
MSSRIRCSAFLVMGGMLVLVSSFSNNLPARGSIGHRDVAQVCSFTNSKHSLSTQEIWQRSTPNTFLSMASSPAATADESQQVGDLFSKYCDDDNLIDKKTLESMPPFAMMLADEDLLPAELNDIWEAALKSSKDPSRVDSDSFAQIYRDVDDLFEDDEEEDEDEDEDSGETDASSEPADSETQMADATENELDEELSKAYKSLCDENGLISKKKMLEWEEIESLLEEGLLGEDEFEELWANSVSDNAESSIDSNGFLTFNLGLDELFELDDEDEEDDEEEEGELPPTPATPRAMVIEGDMPPGVLFSQLADENYLVGSKELILWVELKDMLEEGDLLESELKVIFKKYATPEGKLTEETFVEFYDEIDGLFEEDDDEDGEEVTAAAPTPPQQAQPNTAMSERVKGDFLSFIDIVIEEDEEPCGFGASEADQEQVLNILKVLEQQPTNMIVQKDGNIEQSDLAGTWELIYTSSSAMKFNKGLSGIGGSFPNGKFGSLRQDLIATKFLSDMFYKERIDVNPSSASFDVTVNGVWDLRKSVSIFTGQPTVILNVEPDRVTYGPTSTRADHWKSLGPVNRLDLSYLDDDLRVMRGCTSSETVFVFKKV